MRVLCISALLALGACGESTESAPLGQPGTSSEASTDAGANARCADLDDTACRARSDCAAVNCDACRKSTSYCMDRGLAGSFSCPRVACPECESFDRESCTADTGCEALVAPDCNGEISEMSVFVCYDPRFGPPDMPPPFCPCEVLKEPACQTSNECHGVYRDASELCDCAEPGCCMAFDRCTDGDFADCTLGTQVSCRRMEPVCGQGYAVSYVDMCYEGCARTDECAF